jgi:hypothetical protein
MRAMPTPHKSVQLRRVVFLGIQGLTSRTGGFRYMRWRRLGAALPDFYHWAGVFSGVTLWPAGLPAESGGFAH